MVRGKAHGCRERVPWIAGCVVQEQHAAGLGCSKWRSSNTQADIREPDQLAWLKEASTSIKRNAYFLRKAMDEDDMKDALRYAASMLGELRTSMLGPQRYYELYMQACDELHYLESFFAEERGKGRAYGELYELVQHAGNVLPRLYLLCAAGACYIRSKEAPAKVVLRDLAEMCRGVQHATRGLFLRAYLVQVCRTLLPTAGSGFEGPEGGSVVDAVDFLLLNFGEMNKLWVRLAHQGTAADRRRREAERAQLADLVGKNLTYLSQLDGLNFALYRDVVLPRVLEQIVSCRDELAQQYLMQALILGFSDEFHLGTLKTLLGALPDLNPGVKLAPVLASLLERLAAYAAAPGRRQVLHGADAFGALAAVAQKVVRGRADLPLADLAAMHAALLSFASAVYPDRLDYVQETLAACCEALRGSDLARDPRAEKQLVALLAAPLDAYSLLEVLALPNYRELISFLSFPQQREAALHVAKRLLTSSTSISTSTSSALVLDILAPLLAPHAESSEEDCGLVARLAPLFANPDPSTQHALLEALFAALRRAPPAGQAAALPAVCHRTLHALRAACSAPDAEATLSLEERARWARLAHAQASALAALGTGSGGAQGASGAQGRPCAPNPALAALSVFALGAEVLSQHARLELAAYEFAERALVLHEEAASEAWAATQSLQVLLGALSRCRVFGPELRAVLSARCVAYCGRLLRRGDQGAAALAAAHVFWQPAEEGERDGEQEAGAALPSSSRASPSRQENAETDALPPEVEALAGGAGALFAAAPATLSPLHPPERDGRGALACLKRALRVASAAAAQLRVGAGAEEGSAAAAEPAMLVVDALNAYLYFQARGLPGITSEAVGKLAALAGSMAREPGVAEYAPLQAYYARTLAHPSVVACGLADVSL